MTMTSITCQRLSVIPAGLSWRDGSRSVYLYLFGGKTKLLYLIWAELSYNRDILVDITNLLQWSKYVWLFINSGPRFSLAELELYPIFIGGLYSFLFNNNILLCINISFVLKIYCTSQTATPVQQILSLNYFHFVFSLTWVEFS